MSASDIELSAGDLRQAALSVADDAGTVFFWQDKVLRAVPAEAADKMRALLASGLLEALVGKGWIPRCRLASVRLKGFEIVIEQDLLPVVSYPYEWTYGMLRDAALRVLEINLFAREYGWELKDCHGFNLVFDGGQPVWVDLGSFVPCPRTTLGWPAYEEFLRCYEYPLRIWADGGAFVARRLSAASEYMAHSDYGLYRWPWLRWGGIDWYQRWLTRWHSRVRQLSRIPKEKIQTKLPGPLGYLVGALVSRGWFPWQNVSLRRAHARIVQRKYRLPAGFWSHYQAEGVGFVATPRFRRIEELIRLFQITSVIELGGNQGQLSAALLQSGAVSSAICTDADERAVNAAYERTKQSSGRLNTAVLDFIFPMSTPFGEAPIRRLQSDTVLALAVTHHLILTQKVPIKRMLRIIGSYASRMVFVEFMPLGLWDGKTAPPIPAWYTLDWFRAEFSQEFDLRHEEQVETNRILFCGTVRQNPIGSEESGK